MNTLQITKLNACLVAPPKYVDKTAFTAGALADTLTIEEAVNSVVELRTDTTAATLAMPTGKLDDYLGPDRDPEGNQSFWTRFICTNGNKLNITLSASTDFPTGADIVFTTSGDFAEFLFTYNKATNSLSAIRYRVSVTA